ncbi:MAG: hypothetical protein AUK47_03155 [Deltaproteobacteria bacterium CG2_30_63_29]|nr:MAG: hypothetical protein AUK47_03155 [Deltaproteobacteria bacterium CG2_30_63_29]PJB36122.1 MAG: low molecular weight protein arginine phosphatase [Deltaproteobacteria bacterium CG_4_9_14_3_um_filter_63_12]
MDWNYGRIIMVCSGNICRSPMAQELARLKFEERGLRPMIISMGTLGIVGRPAEPHAVEAIAQIGGDLSRHSSQSLSRGLVDVADVVFGMDATHMVAIRQCGTNAFKNSKLLAKYHTPPKAEIWDPVGGSLADFCFVRDEISSCLDAWFRTEVE